MSHHILFYLVKGLGKAVWSEAVWPEVKNALMPEKRIRTFRFSNDAAQPTRLSVAVGEVSFVSGEQWFQWQHVVTKVVPPHTQVYYRYEVPRIDILGGFNWYAENLDASQRATALSNALIMVARPRSADGDVHAFDWADAHARYERGDASADGRWEYAMVPSTVVHAPTSAQVEWSLIG
ncbi:hypothetical protein [Streptomyces venezuelae]|uniref:hypothetical protein n=1 Tax=Streptomyces venezuelae TaxID=54571 RepID=UPI00378796F6